MSGQGTATTIMALGVIGPAATIAIGTIVGFPSMALAGICVLQIAIAYLRTATRRGRT